MLAAGATLHVLRIHTPLYTKHTTLFRYIKQQGRLPAAT